MVVSPFVVIVGLKYRPPAAESKTAVPRRILAGYLMGWLARSFQAMKDG
jgi:hypothetical protein